MVAAVAVAVAVGNLYFALAVDLAAQKEQIRCSPREYRLRRLELGCFWVFAAKTLDVKFSCIKGCLHFC